MFAKCCSGAIMGVDATGVEIEVTAHAADEARFTIVGLPDTSVRESKDRVNSAIIQSGFGSRHRFSITVNLAPADVRKEGPMYDLPIALGVLMATERMCGVDVDSTASIGELALSGQVRRVNGALPIVLAMKKLGKKRVLVPRGNLQEASIVSGIDVIPVDTLAEAAGVLAGTLQIQPVSSDLANLVSEDMAHGDDFADVKGQEAIKRAVEIAVAGGHNILMIGSPGSGKTMIARRIPSILPEMTVEEALEVSKIHSVAGQAKSPGTLVTRRPFRAPHHTVSSVGLLGGGSHPKPGEVSLAHRGVLFLDEFAEFSRDALEVMRQPVEDGFVSVARAAAAVTFPSRFMLVAAMNPCPCGYYNDPTRTCRCSARQIANYQHRISGPLLDRIDIQINVKAVPLTELYNLKQGESSSSIRARVVAAREIQRARYRNMPGVVSNSDVRGRYLADVCRLSESGKGELQRLVESVSISARAYDRILRVARTIADLAGREQVERADIFEAASYRQLDNVAASPWR